MEAGVNEPQDSDIGAYATMCVVLALAFWKCVEIGHWLTCCIFSLFMR
jgi:hypothetical protein